MCGTEKLIGVQLVPQGKTILRLGIVNTVAGFCARAEKQIAMAVKSRINFLISGQFWCEIIKCGPAPQKGVSQKIAGTISGFAGGVDQKTIRCPNLHFFLNAKSNC